MLWKLYKSNYIINFRARRVLRFCRHHNLSAYIRDQVSTHLKSKYVSKLKPSEEHGIFKSLPRPIPGMIQQYLYNNYVMRVCHLFEGVSNAIHMRLVHEMEPIIFMANSTVILQDESPTCLYFVIRGSFVSVYISI
ncbi:putative ion channel, cNMP-binding protein [Medicago truncatula]|uniref:Putative ion channel, cNMP-binding protein n=1 Tax=Medicago truncatula TaxID=3880 RepID=A0A396JKS5_MEDTR|nr:putative ion channel, cNMP-binding protein [Medicago truncatula]